MSNIWDLRLFSKVTSLSGVLTLITQFSATLMIWVIYLFILHLNFETFSLSLKTGLENIVCFSALNRIFLSCCLHFYSRDALLLIFLFIFQSRQICSMQSTIIVFYFFTISLRKRIKYFSVLQLYLLSEHSRTDGDNIPCG